jgi:hypothetical protein
MLEAKSIYKQKKVVLEQRRASSSSSTLEVCLNYSRLAAAV